MLENQWYVLEIVLLLIVSIYACWVDVYGSETDYM